MGEGALAARGGLDVACRDLDRAAEALALSLHELGRELHTRPWSVVLLAVPVGIAPIAVAHGRTVHPARRAWPGPW